MSARPGSRRRALWFSLFWTAVGGASYLLGVQSALGQRAEATVLDAAEFTTNPPPPLNLVSEAGIAIALAVIGLLALATHGWRRAIGVVAVSGVAIGASQLLKLRVLSRPELFELDAPNTFPSGHMTTFTVLVAALIWAVPAVARGFTALGGAVLLSVVAWQLLAYGWHRPSDVFGAIALGVAGFAAAALIRPLSSGRSAVMGRLIAIVLVMSAWVLLAIALVMLVVAVSSGDTDLMLGVGQLGAFSMSAFATRTVMLLAEPR
ncbi:phosphatase PAP2 family protein [Leucobacter ruminantium]|uniref:Phosphatase PAP2 family protein n=1 Tax=Leucobacter ruminantium TaxID=1289170 RepID=A0A939RYQ4_9MICO|nr:phosphatase PAP2 family protein [Leucobacter ruminantium]